MDIITEMKTTAYKAAKEYCETYMDGEDRGACGFAWVTLWPEHKGNTKLGKIERKEFERLGASKDWTGKAWMLWNPSGYAGQSMCVKEVGALAYAKVLQEYGFNAYMQSRPD